MEMHQLVANLSFWISIFILGVAVTQTTNQINNAKSACFILCLISLLSGIMFFTFPTVLEDDYDFFTLSLGSENEVYFWNEYTDSNNNVYKWGQNFLVSSTAIIPCTPFICHSG